MSTEVFVSTLLGHTNVIALPGSGVAGVRSTSTSVRPIPARTREPASTSEAVSDASACPVKFENVYF